MSKAEKLYKKEEKEREKLIKEALKSSIKPDKPKEEEKVYAFDESKVEEIKDDEETIEETVEIINENHPEKQIVDFSLSVETRIKALNLFYKKYGEGDTIEAINRISMMYDMSNTSTLKEYILSIMKESEISAFLKSLIAISLASKDYSLAEDSLFVIYENLMCSTPYKLDMIKLMMRSEKHREECLRQFLLIIEDPFINEEFRYKSILSLENEKSYFIIEALKAFSRNNKNKVSFRILALQNLLSRNLENASELQSILRSFVENETVDYNLRADAADVLLRYGTDEMKTFAKDAIKRLGIGEKKIFTLYSNAQNVHTEEIEESVVKILEFLSSSELKCNDNLEKVISSIKKLVEEAKADDPPLGGRQQEHKLENISLSLSRISVDRALYSKYSCSLAQILVKVWNYIQGNKDKEEMQKRLLEELYDMCGICSSGFVSRLINCISGFGDFSLRISWRDQIISNITGRLNAQIRNMDNITLSELILEEMTLESSDFEKRKHFLKFFRKVIPEIRNEMEDEFVKHISSEEFDLYFRAGIMMYETGGHV